jgi:hypothetical protein
MPVIGSLLRLSAGAPLSGERAIDLGAEAAYLTSAGIRYIGPDRRRADLIRWSSSAITPNAITQEGIERSRSASP